jgi:hypothetical protein
VDDFRYGETDQRRMNLIAGSGYEISEDGRLRKQSQRSAREEVCFSTGNKFDHSRLPRANQYLLGIYPPGYEERRRQRLKEKYGVDINPVKATVD